jgi:hypothetical protein
MKHRYIASYSTIKARIIEARMLSTVVKRKKNGVCVLHVYSDNFIQYYEMYILDYVPATQDYVLRISFAVIVC